jgi:hypothetical protein
MVAGPKLKQLLNTLITVNVTDFISTKWLPLLLTLMLMGIHIISHIILLFPLFSFRFLFCELSFPVCHSIFHLHTQPAREAWDTRHVMEEWMNT